MTSWIRRLPFLVLVPMLAEASPPPPAELVDAPLGGTSTSATTEPADVVTAGEVAHSVPAVPAEADAAAVLPVDRRRRELKTSYEMRMFKLRDGGLFELAWCDARKPTTWSRYVCWAVNLGRQDGRWVEGELVTFGARYRPGRGPLTIVAGGGAGLVTVMTDAVICMARKPGPGRFQNHNPPSRKCNGSLFPFELAAELGVRTAIPAGRLGVEVQVIARYHANINGDGTDLIGRVPAGPMVSAGASLIF
ncbi:MAG TPA: hypothetical protein VNO30_50095 [Kofleriaceae bacterium]|nr:hypothetical protein [Kofleriaceae bacterium]